VERSILMLRPERWRASCVTVEKVREECELGSGREI
jgi:hypothetical protein